MTDRANKIILAVALFAVIAFMFVYKKPKETETAKQAVVTAQASVDRVKSEYTAIKGRNIQKENEVAKNVVQDLCKMYSDDGDALIGWSNLVTRAREHNRQWSDSQD